MVFECRQLRRNGEKVIVDLVADRTNTIRLNLSREDAAKYVVGSFYALNLSLTEAPKAEVPPEPEAKR